MKSFKEFNDLQERVDFLPQVSVNKSDLETIIKNNSDSKVGSKLKGGSGSLNDATIIDIDDNVIVTATKNGAYFYIVEINIKKVSAQGIVFSDPQSMKILKSLL